MDNVETEELFNMSWINPFATSYIDIFTIPLLAMLGCLVWKSKNIQQINSEFDLYESIVEMSHSKCFERDKNLMEDILIEFYKICLFGLKTNQVFWEKEKASIVGNAYKGIIAVIERKEKSEIQFHHRTFQEYFAAKYFIFLMEKENFEEINSIFQNLFPEEKSFNSNYRDFYMDLFEFVEKYDSKIAKEIIKLWYSFHFNEKHHNYLETPVITFESHCEAVLELNTQIVKHLCIFGVPKVVHKSWNLLCCFKNLCELYIDMKSQDDIYLDSCIGLCDIFSKNSYFEFLLLYRGISESWQLGKDE